MISALAAFALDLVSDPADAATIAALDARIAAGGADAAAAWIELAQLAGEAADPEETLRRLSDGAIGDDAASTVAVVIVRAFAVVRVDYPAQPDAVAARELLAAEAEAAYQHLSGALGADGFAALTRIAGEAIMQLSRIAATRAPLVQVETGISLPSSLIAYDLYGDPARGGEIVTRNRTGLPMLMPVRLTASAR